MVQEFVKTVKSDPEIRTRLKSEIKRLSITVEVLAELSGIPKGTLDNIMSGRVESMKDVHLQAIAQAIPDLDIRFVLTGENLAPSAETYKSALEEIKTITDNTLKK